MKRIAHPSNRSIRLDGGDYFVAMKSINEAITVDACSGVPRRFRWAGRTYHTRKLLDYWILQTRWWGREERRIYFRLETDRGVVEVYRASGFDADTRSTARPDPPSDAGSERTQGAPRPFRESDTFIEGDTHTRELRRTDFPYRPDARRRRRKILAQTRQLHWRLSKILD